MRQHSVTKESIANSVGSVTFPCPKCGNAVIRRTMHERAIVSPYTCVSCGFTGPN